MELLYQREPLHHDLKSKPRILHLTSLLHRPIMGCARLPRMPSSRYRALTIYNVFFEQNKMAEGDTRNTATGDFVDG